MAECSGDFLAKLFDMTERRVQQLAAEGHVVRLSRGKYDLFPSIKAFCRYQREQARAEEKKLMEENRRIKEIKRQTLEGGLVDAADLERELAKLFTDVKTRIRAIAPKCAQEIAHIKMNSSGRESITAVQDLLRKEHDDALEELSQWKP